MTRNLERRLERASAAAAALRKADRPGDIEHDIAIVKFYLVAAYLGHLQLPHDSPAVAHARALEYPDMRTHQEAMRSSDPEFSARCDNAMRCLYWHAGIEEPNDASADDKIRALDRLIAGLPDELRQDLATRLKVLNVA
jgi:hypothetical protein